MEVISHINLAESRPVFPAGSASGLRERASTEPMKLDEDDDNPLAAISTGKTSRLPLIGLPKKKVDFNPNQSIIQPVSADDELWCNLTAEITRRKSTSSAETAIDNNIITHSPAVTRTTTVAEQQPGRMVGLQRRFKKALTRLRKAVFRHSPNVATNEFECSTTTSPDPVRRSLVTRRDSNVSSAKRLAAKRKRPSVTANDFLERQWIRQFHPPNMNHLECDPGTSEITSELQEIFEHLTVSVSKRPRLDSDETCLIRTC